MLRLLSTTIRLAVILVVIVALMSLPLVTIHRSRCTEDRKPVTRWSFVLPWDDPENGDCHEHQNGFEVLREEAGLD